MKKFFRSRRQRGQSIIEFAVIAPAFLALMLFTIYGGMMISDYLALKHVAGTAARVATLSGITDDDQIALKSRTALMVCDRSTLTLTAEKLTGGNFVCVTASADVKIPIVKRWFGDTLKAISAPEYKG